MRKLPRAADQCRQRHEEAPREREEATESRGVEERRLQDNPAAAIACFPQSRRAGKWRKSNKSLFLHFSFITCRSAIAESIHNGRSKQISLFNHQNRDYISSDGESYSYIEMCLGLETFLTDPWVIEVPGKEAFFFFFSFHTAVTFTRCSTRFAHWEEEQNKLTLKKKYEPNRELIHSLSTPGPPQHCIYSFRYSSFELLIFGI